MPLEPDPMRAADVLARLEALRTIATSAEDDVLASLVVTGEPTAQRVLDDWLDQVADTLRAIGTAADELAPALARFSGSTTPASEAAVRRHDLDDRTEAER